MSKWLAILLAGLALLAGATGLALAQQSAALRLAPTPPAAAQLTRSLGLNIALEQASSQERSAALDAIAAAGFGWVRQRFPWDQIEPERGVFAWESWDELVAALDARGLQVVAVLDGAPAWARAEVDAANPLAPPASRADFGRFAAAVAQRYGSSLRFYQIWDEPNIAPHWGNRYVDAADYAALLREGAVQVRSADPDAVVLLAALAPTVEGGGLNQSDVAYLDALYAAGAAPWFDAAAAQPYGFDRPPDDPPAAGRLNFRRAELLRAVMLRREDAATPLWLTAFGWRSDDAGAASWLGVDPATQATWAVEALEWARRHWDWEGGLAWAAWQPAQPASDLRWGFALVAPDGQPTPTLAALSGWAQATHPLGPGVWPVDWPAIGNEGGWRQTRLAADPPHGAALGNNRLLLPFEGAALALTVQRGPYWGFLDVAIDGAPANALPRDAAQRANLLLHDPLGQEATVVVARDLAAGPHLAEISASGGWEQWPLLAVQVASQTTGGWPGWLVWALGLGGVALTGAGLWGLERRRAAARPAAAGPGPSRFAPAQRVPTALRYGLLALLCVAVALGPAPLQLAGLGLLWLLFLLFPATGLALLAAVAPLFLTPLPLLGRAFSPVELTAWLLATALAARLLMDAAAGWRSRRSTTPPAAWPPMGLNALDWPVLALLAVALASLAAADNLGVALRELRTVIVTGALGYGLVRLAPADAAGRFDPWPVVWGIGLGAAVVAGWGLVQAVDGVGLIGAEGVWRVRGPFGSPNNLALYLGHALPIMLAVATFGRDRRRRLAAGLLSLLILLGLVLTFSKGALLLALPAAVLFMGFAIGGRWRWIALGALAVGALALLPLFATERFAGLFDLQGGTSFLRVQLWRGAWNMVQDHPWLGVGLDNFLYAYRTRYALPAAWQELNLSHPHNVVLDFWTRLGFLGLLVGLWLFTAAFWQGWPAFKRASGERRALLLGLLAALVATLAHGLIDNSLFLVDLMLLFMLSLGLIARLAEAGTDKTSDGAAPAES